MQSYDYRPSAGKMALGLVLFGGGAVVMASQAMTDHRAMLINHLIYLAPDQATYARWIFSGMGAVLAVFTALGLIQALIGKAEVWIGEDRLEMPKSPFSAQTVTIAYRDIAACSLITARNHRFLKLRTGKGSFTLVEARLPTGAFDDIARAIANGRERAWADVGSGPAGPNSPPRPASAATQVQAPVMAPRPAAPNAPRAFGRRN